MGKEVANHTLICTGILNRSVNYGVHLTLPRYKPMEIRRVGCVEITYGIAVESEKIRRIRLG